MSKVLSGPGVPIAEDFRSSSGTPIIIDSTTGLAYALRSDGVVVSIAEEGGGTWGAIAGTLADQTDLVTALGTKAASSHTHAIADSTGLQTALDAKAASSHTHAIADSTGLQTALDGKAASSHTHAIADSTGLQTALDGKAATSHSHAIADSTGLQAALDAKAASSHNHAAGDINSGTVATGRLGSGSATSSTYLRGDQTWAAVAATDPSYSPTLLTVATETGHVQVSRLNSTLNDRVTIEGTGRLVIL